MSGSDLVVMTSSGIRRSNVDSSSESGARKKEQEGDNDSENAADSLIRRMLTEDEVDIDVSSDDQVMHRIAEALIRNAENGINNNEPQQITEGQSSSEHVPLMVEKLSFCGGLQIEGAKAFSRALEEMARIRAQAVDEQSVRPALKDLFVWFTQQPDCLAALSPGLLKQSPTLTCLGLVHCHLAAQDAVALASVIENNVALETVVLNGNHSLGDKGTRILAQALRQHSSPVRESAGTRQSSLKKLYIEDCNITQEGAAALGESLSYNTSLELLSLHENRIGDPGAVALARGLLGRQPAAPGTRTTTGGRRSGLKQLLLSYCNIGDSGAAALGELLESNLIALNSLIVCCGNRDMTLTGVRSLATGLSRNASIVQLELPHAICIPANLMRRVDRDLNANRFRAAFLATIVEQRRLSGATAADVRYYEDEAEVMYCPNTGLPLRLWPSIYERISSRPLSLYQFIRENEHFLLTTTSST